MPLGPEKTNRLEVAIQNNAVLINVEEFSTYLTRVANTFFANIALSLSGIY